MSVPSWARVGAKVVCIEAANRNGRWFAGEALSQDAVYTITRAFINSMGIAAIELAEVRRTPGSPKEANGYAVGRFRPLVTRTQEQDVTAIRKLVDEMPITERLDRIGELL